MGIINKISALILCIMHIAHYKNDGYNIAKKEGEKMAYDQKQKEYTMKYLKKLKEVRFRVQMEEYEKYEEAAKQAGYPSMRQFYMDAIQEKTEKILN